MGEIFIVGGIIALALLYVIRHFRRARKGGGCGGCDCQCPDKENTCCKSSTRPADIRNA